ncbi:unnamed protein product [Polarella glacialis]|uniref:Uncharacterized protein n=1 Tax=Polarella glacialis TaxID=89957 RepID=A0A813ET55_POLGL|nr:unnamed protein product [Polarella glacialis]
MCHKMASSPQSEEESEAAKRGAFSSLSELRGEALWRRSRGAELEDQSQPGSAAAGASRFACQERRLPTKDKVDRALEIAEFTLSVELSSLRCEAATLASDLQEQRLARLREATRGEAEECRRAEATAAREARLGEFHRQVAELRCERACLQSELTEAECAAAAGLSRPAGSCLLDARSETASCQELELAAEESRRATAAVRTEALELHAAWEAAEARAATGSWGLATSRQNALDKAEAAGTEQQEQQQHQQQQEQQERQQQQQQQKQQQQQVSVRRWGRGRNSSSGLPQLRHYHCGAVDCDGDCKQRTNTTTAAPAG